MQADREHGQDQGGPGACARYRKPLQLYREQQDHQQTEPETGERRAQQDHGHHGTVDPAVLEHRGQGAGGDAHGGGENERQATQAQAVGKVFGDQLEHRTAQDDGIAQVAGEQVAQPDTVLQQQGLVQTITRYERGLLLWRRPDLDHVVDRVAGHQVDDREDDHRDCQENGNQQEQAPDQVIQQRDVRSAVVTLASCLLITRRFALT